MKELDLNKQKVEVLMLIREQEQKLDKIRREAVEEFKLKLKAKMPKPEELINGVTGKPYTFNQTLKFSDRNQAIKEVHQILDEL